MMNTMARRNKNRKRYIYHAPRSYQPVPGHYRPPAPAHVHKLKMIKRQAFGAWVKVWVCEDPACDYEDAFDMEVGP